MNHPRVQTRDELLALLKATKPSDVPLGQMLVSEGKLSAEDLATVLESQQGNRGKHLGDLLVEQGLCSRESITAALANKLGIPYVSLADFPIEPDVLAMIPADIALQYAILPLARAGKHLIVAMENPLDWEAMEVLRFHTNHNIDAVVCSRAEIGKALERYYAEHDDEEGLAREIVDAVEQVETPAQERPVSLQDIAREAQKVPIVRLVNAVIIQGISQRASDINIRPGRAHVDVYYRIDGKLHHSRSLHRSLLPPLVSRIKIMGGMNIAERRLPQDGHARMHYRGNLIDLRISSIPTVTGESVVVRVLDKQAGLKPLNELGLCDSEFNAVQRIISRSQGMFLVTGPTGSGKSTTLYAVLRAIRNRNPHIITVEDPVEYDMEGLEQIQVLPANGYTFAEALRHILRHDPDVIMVGEIRDLETARIANKAALTGHLVLSTLHTNDAASTVTRLIDMGVERYLLGSTLLGVMAQRLVRVNCPECREVEPADEQVRHALGVAEDETFFRGTGCQACQFTGYRGRQAVCELLEVTPTIADLIGQGATAQQIRNAAVEDGMHPLTENALTLARRGLTSLEEVFAVRLE